MKETKNTHFGFTQIDKKEKNHKVQQVFNSVAGQYDLMNNLMSMGFHNVWKKILIETTTLRKKSKILDIAAGTADLTIAFSKKNRDYKIFHTDINLHMLKEGQKKIINNGKIIPSIACNAENLPFTNNYFDCVTIGFGLRNMTNKDKALNEVYRVLAPGGRIVILEFSQIWNPLQKIYDLFSFKVIPKLGKLFANNEESYKYLVESIRMHPNQEDLKKIMIEQGYEKITYMNLSAGIVSIHKGFKA